jgi:hypothetical protein
MWHLVANGNVDSSSMAAGGGLAFLPSETEVESPTIGSCRAASAIMQQQIGSHAAARTPLHSLRGTCLFSGLQGTGVFFHAMHVAVVSKRLHCSSVACMFRLFRPRRQLPCIVCRLFSSHLAAHLDLPGTKVQQAKACVVICCCCAGAGSKGAVRSVFEFSCCACRTSRLCLSCQVAAG